MSLNVDRTFNQDTSTKALLYYKLLTSFEFISALVLTRHVLDVTLPVTELLQGPAIDVADSYFIESLKSLINSKRIKVDQFHKNFYKSVLELPKKVKGTLSGLRQLLTAESPLKMKKNVFYFASKALFVLNIFKFLS